MRLPEYTPIFLRRNNQVFVYNEDLANFLRLKVARSKKHKLHYTLGDNGALVAFNANTRGWYTIERWVKEYYR